MSAKPKSAKTPLPPHRAAPLPHPTALRQRKSCYVPVAPGTGLISQVESASIATQAGGPLAAFGGGSGLISPFAFGGGSGPISPFAFGGGSGPISPWGFGGGSGPISPWGFGGGAGPISPWPRLRGAASDQRRFPFEALQDADRRELARVILGKFDSNLSPEFRSLGYRSDLPDGRDFDLQNFAKRSTPEELAEFKRRLAAKPGSKNLPQRVHLADQGKGRRSCFSPIQDQGMYSSCTAHSVTDMMEFHYRKSLPGPGDAAIEFSRLFAYKMGRHILNWQGDDGCQIRAVIKAILEWGAPLEEHWPYVDGLLHQYPSPEVFERAENYNGRLGLVAYYRVANSRPDMAGAGPAGAAVREARALLACGLPIACGVFLPRSVSEMAGSFSLPVPDLATDPFVGGHAILLVGYDETFPYEIPGEGKAKGAFIFRNSWGDKWGDLGYGFLPYAYLEKGYAVDLWVGRLEQAKVQRSIRRAGRKK